MIHPHHNDLGEVYLISSHSFWLPGGYATKATAHYAFQFTIAELRDLNDRIYSIDGENRPITIDDLKALKKTRTPG